MEEAIRPASWHFSSRNPAMHLSCRSPLREWLAVSLLALSALEAAGQVIPKPPRIGEEEPPFTTGLALPTDRRAQQVLNQCQDWIDGKNWEAAASALQALLDQREDGFAQVPEVVNDKPSTRTVSIRTEANRLLGALPAEGKKAYLKLHGENAEQRLKQARQLEDPDLLADVASRYLHTPAGPEALLLLGNRALSRDDPLLATLYFERRLRLPEAAKISPLNLYRMALAFYRAGEKPQGDRLWKQLAEAVKQDGGLKVGNEFYNLDQLRKLFDQVFTDEVPSLSHWPIFRGGPRRTEPAAGGAPFLDAAWTASTLPEHVATKAWTENNLDNAVAVLRDQRGQPILPTFFPIATRGRLYFRSYDGIHAVEAKEQGKLAWYSYTDGGLQTLLHDANKKAQLEQWSNIYRQNGPQGILFEHSVLGCLSTDGDRIFAVDDLAVPPHPAYLRNFMWGGFPNFGALTELVNANSLKGYNAASGKLMWELGGKFDRQSGLDSGHFLGAPLPLGGRLYVLHEKNSELRLVCLEPRDTLNAPTPPDVIWTQTLSLVKDKLLLDFHRRTNAVHLAYADGILVCPTNAGSVLGVDLISHSLVWAHAYRQEQPQPNPPGRPMPFAMPPAPPLEWRTAAPAIHERKVVFSAPDAAALHCLDLRDGTLLWRAKREADDLYFAGIFAGKALIVGKNHCKALDLEKGTTAWRLDDVGIPSGQGTASGNVYYLPLYRGPDKEPEISAVDMAQGKITAHFKSRKREVPGNLIFAEGVLYSQTLKGIAAYPLIQAKLNLIDERLKKDPKDPVALIERGALRLEKGELENAYADLHAALANKPPAEVVSRGRSKLYETLAELLQGDFAKYEKHLDEFKTLSAAADPDEQRRRQGAYFLAVGKGRARQGRPVEAMQAYLDFTALAGEKELLAVPDEPTVKAIPSVWVAGRIAALMDQAKPEQRRALEEKAGEQFQAIQGKNDLAGLRRFVGSFGPAFAAGRQARLQLAEQLLATSKDPKADELREAQLLLLQLRGLKESDAVSAGRAVETLARLMTHKGLLDHAVHYYRELRRDHAKTVIKEGKTGAELFEDVENDKRFLPYLAEPKQSWQGKFKATELAGNNPIQQTFTLDPIGEALPFFRQHRLVLDITGNRLFAVNQATGKRSWATDDLIPLGYLVQWQAHIRTTVSLLGHVAVVNLGHMVYALDPVDGKLLWEYNLLAPGTKPAPALGQILRDRDGNSMLIYQDGWIHKLGTVVLIDAGYVVLLTRQGLTVLEARTGEVRWTREDVKNGATHVFGDREQVYLAEVKDGIPAATRVLRAIDGSTIKAPDFTAAYQRKLRIVDGSLLVQDVLPQDRVQLRLYDPATGKDRWKREFPAKTTILRSEETELTGALEPDGALMVLDLRTGEEKLKAAVPKDDLDKLQDAHLLADGDLFYLVLNKPLDPAQINGIWPSVHLTMRSLPVNGPVHAFERATGKRRWTNAVAHQMIVLEKFDDQPVLLFTARYTKWVNQGNNRVAAQVVGVKSIHKTSGQLLFDKELSSNVNQFHTLKTDAQAGTIDLTTFNLTIRHQLEPANNEEKK
jgi:outer membrane protein assembly factor BamB